MSNVEAVEKLNSMSTKKIKNSTAQNALHSTNARAGMVWAPRKSTPHRGWWGFSTASLAFMELEHITYQGPEIDAPESFISRLPSNLVGLLKQINGFVQFHGGLHVRGLCAAPSWHSLVEAMDGSKSIHSLYSSVLLSDVPFAQDCVADQFILRNEQVYKLYCETGELEHLDVTLDGFFDAVADDPIEFLGLYPLMQFQSTGGALQLGEVLHVYPPFCTKESANGVSLKAVPVIEALEFLASFSAQINELPNGSSIQVKVTR